MNQAVSETKVESVDIKEYLAVLLKRKWLILICFLLSMAATTGFLFTRQPIWRANAKLLVSTAGKIMPTSEVVGEDERSFYVTEINIMLSQTMLKRVQTRLKKTTNDLRELLVNLSVTRFKGATIILISVDSPSRDFAKDFANTLADEYLKYREERRAENSESALLMLTREINRLSQEMKSANDKMLAYAKDHGLALLEDSYQVFNTKYNRLLDMLNAATMDLANAQQRKKLLDRSADATSAIAALAADTPEAIAAAARDQGVNLAGGGDTNRVQVAGAVKAPATTKIPEMPDPDANQRVAGLATLSLALPEGQAQKLFDLEKKRETLELKLESMRKYYKPRHPALLAAERELTDTKHQIDTEINYIREKATSYAKVAQARFDQVKGQVDELNSRALGDVLRMQELNAMKGDVVRVQTLYNTLLGKLTQIDVSQGFSLRTIAVLESAIIEDDPVYPKKVKGLLVSAFIGLGLGLALAFFIEYIDDSIKLAEEVERDLQLPFLGMIPAAQWNPDDMSSHRLDKLKSQGGVTEAYRVVRSAIMFSAPREKLQSILVASAVPREGKTTTCVNLAIGFSQVEERVLLVDGDLRRGEIHRYFNVEKEKGLSDILLGEATAEQVIKHSDVPKLDIISTGSYPSNPAELLLGWRLKEFLDWAKKNYDRVILDCTPVMGIADSAILGSAADGVLFVIWAGRTSRRYVRVAKMTAVSRGAKIFGFVLNNLEPGRVGYYHYYPYYYSYYSRGSYYAAKPEDAGKGGGLKGEPVPTEPGDEEKIDDVY